MWIRNKIGGNKMTEFETLAAELEAYHRKIKEIQARMESIILGIDIPGVKPIKAWVATDDYGWTSIFEDKPIRKGREWYGDTSYEDLSDKLPFKAPKWEDEPIQVEILIKKI